jgi:phosphatidylinositol alpha-1,6-mannosyltransferase
MYFFLSISVFLKIRKYDVVILNISGIGNGMLSFLLSFFKSKVVIFAYAEELTLAINARGLKGYIKRFFLKGYKMTNLIISVSDFAKDILNKKLFVSSEIKVIPTPLHGKKNNLKKSNKKSDYFEILSVGRLIRRKGFDLLINAFYKVNQSHKNAKLTIIGDGPEYDNIKTLIKNYDLEDNIKILKNVTDKQLNNFYCSSDLFILANYMLKNGDCEGAPNVIVEAASYGLPVIAGTEGGTSNVVEDNITGILLNPKDTINFSNTINKLIDDEKKLIKMGEEGILKVHNCHSKEIAGKIFRECIINL